MSKWIKCSERMPDDFVDVLVSDGAYVEVMWFDSDGYWDGWVEPQAVTVDSEEVTHWMPLPDPPEV